jgi:hypothetical protein
MGQSPSGHYSKTPLLNCTGSVDVHFKRFAKGFRLVQHFPLLAGEDDGLDWETAMGFVQQ